MSKKFKAPTCSYTMGERSITTDGTVKKKVTGTSVAGILNKSPFTSPFRVACDLLGLTREDISGKASVEAGRICETPIINYLNIAYPDKIWLTAEEVYEKREGDHDSWASDFDNEVFGGHVDGIALDDDGSQYILEIKTSSNLDSWTDGVPEYYFLQVALYNAFLTHQDKAYVALGMMTPESLRRPEQWVPGEDNVVLFEMPIDQEDVADTMAMVMGWYSKYIMNGKTPEYDPSDPRDVEVWEYLQTVASPEGLMKDKLDRLSEVEEEISARETEFKGLYDERDDLRKDIKEYMVGNDVIELDSENSPFYGVITTSERRKIDPALLAADGIDVEKYYVTTISKSFTVKRRKV